MQCPACKDVTLVMTERQSVEVDYCPECRGVWLDRGELDKIIERSASFDVQSGDSPPRRDARSGSRRDDDDDDDDYERRDSRRRKKKGFLGELFDFD